MIHGAEAQKPPKLHQAVEPWREKEIDDWMTLFCSFGSSLYPLAIPVSCFEILSARRPCFSDKSVLYPLIKAAES